MILADMPVGLPIQYVEKGGKTRPVFPALVYGRVSILVFTPTPQVVCFPPHYSECSGSEAFWRELDYDGAMPEETMPEETMTSHSQD